jgi:uncharacterized protein YdeI (YjbR/CyaY-like superfamily)
MNAVHFSCASEFRRWLGRSHSTAAELLVAFHRKESGKAGMGYSEALDEALCFGWIDGVRRRIDAGSYSIRFSPRRACSTWSLVNVRHAERLIAAGRMQPAGLGAFRGRDLKRTGIYSFEQRPKSLPARLERLFRANPRAWRHWEKQPPGYRRTATWWVVSAVREETRLSRLGRLIGDSERGRRLGLLAQGPRAPRRPV